MFPIAYVQELVSHAAILCNETQIFKKKQKRNPYALLPSERLLLSPAPHIHVTRSQRFWVDLMSTHVRCSEVLDGQLTTLADQTHVSHLTRYSLSLLDASSEKPRPCFPSLVLSPAVSSHRLAGSSPIASCVRPVSSVTPAKGYDKTKTNV